MLNISARVPYSSPSPILFAVSCQIIKHRSNDPYKYHNPFDDRTLASGKVATFHHTKSTCHHLVLSRPLWPKLSLSKKQCDNTIYHPHFLPLMSSPMSSPTSAATTPLYHPPCPPCHHQVNFHTPATRQRLYHADVTQPKLAKNPPKSIFC